MKEVIIYEEGTKIPKPKNEDAVLLPFPNFMEAEATRTNAALRIARQMRADKITIYRQIE